MAFLDQALKEPLEGGTGGIATVQWRRGQILKQASDNRDELVVADLDMAMVQEVRDLWQFFRDRRPETYNELVSPGR